MLVLIQRDNFRKLTDFTYYEKCLNLVNQYELEEMSKNPAYEELFMNFMRYIFVLSNTDEKKIQGQKLIDKIFEIEKFKAFKNQSLHVLDHESEILDEDEFRG